LGFVPWRATCLVETAAFFGADDAVAAEAEEYEGRELSTAVLTAAGAGAGSAGVVGSG
jgi:hypothetical protein